MIMSKDGNGSTLERDMDEALLGPPSNSMGWRYRCSAVPFVASTRVCILYYIG